MGLHTAPFATNPLTLCLTHWAHDVHGCIMYDHCWCMMHKLHAHPVAAWQLLRPQGRQTLLVTYVETILGTDTIRAGDR